VGSGSNVATKPRFNVCLPRPNNYPHSFCLLELAELVKFALNDLGVPGHDVGSRRVGLM